MKILFKNTTKYDKENRENFVNFHKEKYGTKTIIKGMLIIGVFIYMLIFNFINIGWYSLLILVPLSVLGYFIYKQIKKQKKEKKKKQKNREFSFFFYDRYIKIKSKRQFERMTYFEIKKVFETAENFFLYTDDTHSLILDKEGFEIGNEKDFAEFIKRKCPFKYKNEEENRGKYSART